MKYAHFAGLLAWATLAWAQQQPTSPLPPRLTAPERQQLKSRQAQRVALATQFLQAERARLQVQEKSTFVQRTAALDSLGQLHVRYQQRYEGVPVTGAQVIVHLDKKDQLRSVTGSPVRDLAVRTTPSLTAENAIDLVKLNYPMAPAAKLQAGAQLVIYVTRASGGPGGGLAVRGANLAWKVRADGGRESMYFYVDAHGGTILRKASAELSADYLPATGSGVSPRYPESVVFDFGIADPQPAGYGPYRLRDPLRGNSTAWNMRRQQATEDWPGEGFWSGSAAWGTNAHFDYTSMAVDSAAAIASGFEAQLGMQRLWDRLANVFQMNGLDGAGKGMNARVHAVKENGVEYGDAMWNGLSGYFGDRSATASRPAHSRTELHTVAHEFGHAMWQYALDEDDFEDEARGLNEGQGDIVGSLTNIYHQLGGKATQLPVQTDLLWFRDRIVEPLPYAAGIGQPGLLYYVDHMGQREEHVQGTVYGHAFVFLAYGASPVPGHPLYSTYLPGGMVGIGVQKAAEIWDLALQSYLTSTATFASTRQAYLQAAQDLFGIGSLEVKAVMQAFRGIYVGDPAQDQQYPTVELGATQPNEDEQTVFVTMTATDDLGVASLELQLDGVGVPLDKGLGNVKGAGPKSWSGYVSLENLAPGAHTLRAVAKDASGKTSNTLHNLVLNGRTRLVRNGTFEAGWDSWGRTPNARFCEDSQTAFLGTGCALFSFTEAAVYQQVTIPASATAATLTYRLRTETFSSPVLDENLRVEVRSADGSTVLAVLADHSRWGAPQADSTANGYVPYSASLLAQKGKKVRIYFRATAATAGRFKLDHVNVSVTAPITADFTVNSDPGEGMVTFYVSNIAHIAPEQLKSVSLVFNGQESPSKLMNAPYLAMYATSLFTPNTPYTVKARFRNQSNVVVGETAAEQFTVHPVTNLLLNPGFESPNAHWDAGAGAYGVDDSEMTTKVAFAGTRYGILDSTTAIETITQNVALPADADTITLGFRVKVNRAPMPDVYDRLWVMVLDLSNNVLASVATVTGAADTNQPENYRGFMPVKASLTQFKGQTVRIQFRSQNLGLNPTSFFIDATSVVAKKFGVMQ
ncbi:MAG: M4 family metallopeptidase [Bryobacterales bacterium]|nr:M4 family metallopeptidase [Bryobacterales bacterium]